jgi:flagellar motor switch protein FliN
MTDPSPSSTATAPEPFLQAWAESLAQVLGQITGLPQPSAVLSEAPTEIPAAAAQDFWVICACSGGLRGEMSLRLPPPTAIRFAQTLMGETAAPDAEPAAEASAEQRDAAIELLRQVAGLVASQLKPRWGEVQLRLEAAAGPPSWAASTTAWLRSGADPAAASLVETHLSAALAAALRAEKTETATKPDATAASAPAISSKFDDGVKLDLLMDVELGLTLRFGNRSMTLGEVLDLNPGAVIDLDRQVQDPVDVLLDGRIVARGEVVVVDGNYGLRVTEVGPARVA